MPDPNPNFDKWWEGAKKLDNFRGVPMAAAFAAWLAGVEWANSPTNEPADPSESLNGIPYKPNLEKIVQEYTSTPIQAGTKKIGNYRGDKVRGAKEKIAELNKPKED